MVVFFLIRFSSHFAVYFFFECALKLSYFNISKAAIKICRETERERDSWLDSVGYMYIERVWSLRHQLQSKQLQPIHAVLSKNNNNNEKCSLGEARIYPGGWARAVGRHTRTARISGLPWGSCAMATHEFPSHVDDIRKLLFIAFASLSLVAAAASPLAVVVVVVAWVKLSFSAVSMFRNSRWAEQQKQNQK